MFYLGIINSSAYAETSSIKLFGKYEALWQDNFTNSSVSGGGFTFFEEKKQAIRDTNNDTGLITYVSNSADLPIGYKGSIEYMPFIVLNSSKVPKTTWWQIVTINSIEMNAFVDFLNDTEKKSYVAANYCVDNSWYSPLVKANEKRDIAGVFKWENSTNYNNCRKSLIPLYSIVISRSDLPKYYSWDLSNATDDLLNSTEITIALQSGPLPENSSFTPSSNTLNLYSYGAASQENGYGVSTAPSFEITYTIEPSEYQIFLTFMLTNLLPAIGVIVPAAIWFYRKETKRSKIKNSSRGNDDTVAV